MKRHVKHLIPVAVLAVLLSLPYSTLQIPGVFDGAVNTPGSLQLLALCLLFAGLAVGYDLLFGRLGLMSFGHALYVAIGAYSAELAMKNLHLPLAEAALLAIVIAAVVSTLLGAVSLKGVGKLGAGNLGTVGFAMVTLAFAQAGSILVGRDPKTTGGEEGLPLSTEKVPAALVGVVNTVNLYWLALAYLVVVCGVVWWLTGSRIGRVWQAIRDNERRAEVLGLNPFRYQLGAFVLAGTLGAAGGVVQPAGHRRRHAGDHDHRLHPRAAGHGGARRFRHALGPGARRRALHAAGPPPRRRRHLRLGREPARVPARPAVAAAGPARRAVRARGLRRPRRPGRPAAPATRRDAPDDSEANSRGSAWSRASRTAPRPTASPPSSDTFTSGGYRHTSPSRALIGSVRRSPVWARLPPITTRSGSSGVTRLTSPSARPRANASNAAAAFSSPSSARSIANSAACAGARSSPGSTAIA